MRWTPFEKAAYPPEAFETIRSQFGEAVAADSLDGDVYKNSLYQVHIKPVDNQPGWPLMVWLSIKRLDRQPIHDWRDLQRIKNELVGEQNEGVELYPSEARKVDSANQYHLFVLTDPAIMFPFGFMQRLVCDQNEGPVVAGAVQRPFTQEELCDV